VAGARRQPDLRVSDFGGRTGGLSWYTVLRKRGAYRKAFAGFDPQKVCALRYTAD